MTTVPHAPHPLATVEQIVNTPSRRDGVPEELEMDLRVGGCMLIQEAGIMLALPQSTMATAQVLFHRFYYVSSMLSFGVHDIAISALYLSSKLDETPVRLRDLINTFIYLSARIKHLLSLPPGFNLSAAVSSSGTKGEEGHGWRLGMGAENDNSAGASKNGKGKAIRKDNITSALWKDFTFEVPGFHDEVFWDWKDVIVASEMQILKRLGFHMQVDLPYSHVINYCKILDLVFEDGVAQTAWSILNDALLTPLYAIHPPHTLAVASILLTTRLLRIPLPNDWYLLFDTTEEEIMNCAGTIMVLYDQWGVKPPPGRPKTEETERMWEEGREAREGRWRRVWILSESRKAVRRWVEEREKSDKK